MILLPTFTAVVLLDYTEKLVKNVCLNIPYRTKTRRTKLSKFRLGVENFVRRKILFNILIQNSGINRTKLTKFRRNTLSDEFLSYI